MNSLAYYTEPYLEGVCGFKDGIYIFNGDYTYGIGDSCLAAKVDYARNWWYKHDTGIGVMASRTKPLYPEPYTIPLSLPVHVEQQSLVTDTPVAPLLLAAGIVIGIAILMKFKI